MAHVPTNKMRRASPGALSVCMGNVKYDDRRHFFRSEAQTHVASPHDHRSALLSIYFVYTQGLLVPAHSEPWGRGGEKKGDAGSGEARYACAGPITSRVVFELKSRVLA